MRETSTRNAQLDLEYRMYIPRVIYWYVLMKDYSVMPS